MTDRPKRPRDANQLAKFIVDVATGDAADLPGEQKDKAAQALGKKGGEARSASMTAERRREIAQAAAAKRWAKG
ncbi:MAG: histone H1 [Fuscovulum sp.]|nr:histone H1 [Fuscovulum sp.]